MNTSINNNGKLGEIVSQKSILEKIRSKYILKWIFSNLHAKKLFNFIKYNKKIQNSFDFSADDYKTLSEIEIEIIPFQQRHHYFQSKFISVYEENKLYYHIYFDNSQEEIKRNYLFYFEDVGKIRVKLDYHLDSFLDLFKDCECIRSINFKRFYRNNIKSMNSMFHSCL